MSLGVPKDLTDALTGLLAWLAAEPVPTLVAIFGDAATGFAFLLAWRIYAREGQAKQRAQAERLSAWFAADAGAPDSMEDDAWHLFVRNGSDQPVYNAVVMPVRGVVDPSWWPVLPPQVDEQLPASMKMIQESPSLYSAGVILDFTDAAGRRWRRRGDGRLQHRRRSSRWPTNADTRRAIRAAKRGQDPPNED